MNIAEVSGHVSGMKSGEGSGGHSKCQSVIVCIPTFNRPEGLRLCLDSICRQVFPADARIAVSIVVADNGDGSVASSLNGTAEQFAFPMRAIHVPDRGLCHARNALFAEARGKADFLALIDDDEIASPSWLWSLVETARSHDADAVIGPVFPRYEPGVASWYLMSGMEHNHPKLMRLATGAMSPKRAAHNTLIRSALLEEVPYPWFPLALNFVGSEDRAFFDRAKAMGRDRVIWCAEARVDESIPLDRTSRAFFRKRNLQRGSSEVLAEALFRQMPGGHAPARWKGYVRTVAVFAKAVLLSPCLLSPTYRYRCLRPMFYAVGRLHGHVGNKKELYK